MTDVGLAALVTLGLATGLDALDTERALPEPPELEVSVVREIDSTFCHKPGSTVGHVSLSQTLYRTRRTEVYAHFTHESCLTQEDDKESYNGVGVGIRIRLDFF